MSDNTALIKKSLAGLQDLTLGKGTEEQQRGGGVYTIDKVRLMLPIDTLDVLTTLNPEQFPEVLYVPLGLMYVYNGTAYEPKINIGTTAERPVSPVDGLQFKDTTLKKTVTWYTNNWYDETGSVA